MKNAITLILLFACSQLHATEITIPEALKQNLISLTVTGMIINLIQYMFPPFTDLA